MKGLVQATTREPVHFRGMGRCRHSWKLTFPRVEKIGFPLPVFAPKEIETKFVSTDRIAYDIVLPQEPYFTFVY